MSVFVENQIIGGPAQHLQVRPIIVAALSTLLILTAVGRAGTVKLADYYDTQSERAASALVIPHHSAAPSSGGTGSTGTPAIIVSTAPPACAPDTTYSMPANLSLADAPAGLTQQIDPVHYYKIYGYNSAQVRQQIINCAPKLGGGEDYTGYTTYSLSWRYDYAVIGANECKVTNVKMGLHVSEVLPAWQSAAQADGNYASQWQRFIANLNTHEQGHTVFDKQYAAQALTDLQNLAPAACDSVSQLADATVKADLTALNQANDNYDTVTNHGATQGAILP